MKVSEEIRAILDLDSVERCDMGSTIKLEKDGVVVSIIARPHFNKCARLEFKYEQTET